MDETAESSATEPVANSGCVRTRFAVLEAIEGTEKQIAALHAEQVRLLAEFAALTDQNGAEPTEFAADYLALQVNWTVNMASRRLGHAVALATRLPRVLDALRDGVLDQRRAEVIVEAVEDLPDEVARTVSDQVLAKAEDRNLSQLKRLIRREVLRCDPDGAVRRHTAARAKRRVECYPVADGMAELYACLPATEATVIYQRIDAFTHHTVPGDDRTVDQRRADAFCDLLLNPALGPVGVTVNLTVPATTVSGEGDQPGELTGYGPIDAGQARDLAGWGHTPTSERPRVRAGCTCATTTSMARRIISDAKWRRLITDPVTGGLADFDAKTYRPPAALANFVRARDQRCVFPACSQPATRCDLDHRVPYPKEATTADNLAPLCRRHHRLKHEGGWTLRKNALGYVWINPAGIQYIKTPEPIAEPESKPTIKIQTRPEPLPVVDDLPPPF